MDDNTSLTRFLMLGALETLLNQAVELDPDLAAALRQLHGTVIRVRSERPVFSIYLLLYEDGIEVLGEYEGHVDVRLRGSLGALLQWILAPNSDQGADDPVRVTGPEHSVQTLSRAVASFSLWQALRHWLEQHVQIDQVVAWLRREDPRWLGKLETLAEDVSLIGRELGRQRLLLEEVLDEIVGFKHGLRRERQLDMLFLCSGMVLIVAAFASASGQLPILYLDVQRGLQTLALGSLGLTLILSRILFGHRYPRR